MLTEGSRGRTERKDGSADRWQESNVEIGPVRGEEQDGE
jgi:hypothetical protein